MADLIERQAAIDAIEEMQKTIMRSSFSHEQFVFRGLSDARRAILELPSVQPRKGKISYTKFCEELWGQSSICSLCGCSWQIAEDGSDNFCPNCGCLMEEGDSDEVN